MSKLPVREYQIYDGDSRRIREQRNPNMDIKIGVKNNNFYFKFFEKPMLSPWMLPAITAMDLNQRNQVLSEEVVRRLRRTSLSIVDKKGETVTKILNNMNDKLCFSGYDINDRKNIIENGIIKYNNKRILCDRENRNFYPSEFESRDKRTKKHLTLKQTWYKGRTSKPKNSETTDSKESESKVLERRVKYENRRRNVLDSNISKNRKRTELIIARKRFKVKDNLDRFNESIRQIRIALRSFNCALFNALFLTDCAV